VELPTYQVQVRDPGTGIVCEWRGVVGLVMHWVKMNNPDMSVLWKILGKPHAIYYEK
jgi:hypothetical protein